MTAHAPIPSTPSLHAERVATTRLVFLPIHGRDLVVRNYWSMGTLLDALLTATPERSLTGASRRVIRAALTTPRGTIAEPLIG